MSEFSAVSIRLARGVLQAVDQGVVYETIHGSHVVSPQ